ncbi:MAG TPA: hypothetical protein VHZ73_00330, partial [Vicinamibacterales bacterium]|nr:hypothetical protein [Vicinamibacterales bacterium]
MKRVPAALIVLLAVAAPTAAQSAARASAQTAAQSVVRDEKGAVVVETIVGDDDAERTRERLRQLLRQYPPSLADVLRLDPSLMANDAYLAPYAAIAQFLRQNPSVLHNPAYFVGQSRVEWDESNRYNPVAHELSQDFAGLLIFGGVIAFMGLLAWGVRNLVEHRRWLRTSKVQGDAHAKMIDRLTSNEDLMAYLQSPAGQRYLQAPPLAVDDLRSVGAPVGRILFAAQAGTVVAFLGLGLWFASSRLASNPNAVEVAPVFYTASV